MHTNQNTKGSKSFRLFPPLVQYASVPTHQMNYSPTLLVHWQFCGAFNVACNRGIFYNARVYLLLQATAECVALSEHLPP